MGLTTLTCYRDRHPRERFVDGWLHGLEASYLWGPTTNIPPGDVEDYIGALSEDGVQQLLDVLPDLSTAQVLGLWDSIEETT